MIEVIIGILLAIATGTSCQLGKDAGDWIAWENSHPNADIIMTLETDNAGDFWIYHVPDTDEYLLFKFQNDLSTSWKAVQHGECARIVTAN